jgi:hypothetical protein
MDLMIRDFSQVRVTPRCAFTGMPGDISFCASVGSMTNRSDLEYIRYRYSNSGLPTCSLARASANFATPASPSSETLLTSNVLIFTVRYWTNNNSHSLTPWPNGMDTYNSIPTTNGPVALEVILGLLPTRRTDAYWRNEFARINISNAYMRVFREMIYLPNSRP